MAIEIVKDIPLPPKIRKPKYPLENLGVGDCMIVRAADMPKGGLNSLRAAVTSYCRTYGAESGAKYQVREVPGSEGDYGVWRVK